MTRNTKAGIDWREALCGDCFTYAIVILGYEGEERNKILRYIFGEAKGSIKNKILL